MATAQPKSPKEDMASLQVEAGEGKKTREGSLWVEIRIPSDSDLERRNLKGVYNWILNEAYGPQDVFEFAVVGMPSPEAEGLRTRYFMKAPDYDRKRDLWNRLEGVGVSVHEVQKPPDFSRYDREVRFGMEDDFALPLVPVEEIQRGDFPRTPEQIASAVKDGGAFRMAIRRDDNAKNQIQKFINKEEGKGGDPLKIVEGMFDNLFAGRTYDGVPKSRREKTTQREEETEYSRLAKDRRDKNHAHCEIRAYGNESQVQRISNSFGFELNDIVEHESGEPRTNRKEVKEEIEDGLEDAFELAETVSETREDFREKLEQPGALRSEESRESIDLDLSKVSETLTEASEAVTRASEALENYREDVIVPNRASGIGARLLKTLLFLPFLLPIALAYIDFWNPLSILDFSSSLVMIRKLWPLLIPIGITFGSWLWLFGRKPKPAVLTLQELSVIGSLPYKPESLPVQFETPAVPSFGVEELSEEKSESESEKGGENKDERE